MSKRNFILLIIVLVLATIVFFGFSYLKSDTTPTEDESGNTGINFISKFFNPFRKNGSTPSDATPPITDDGDTGDTTPAEMPKLVKVSTIPIAGFTVFPKERLKDIPTPSVTDESEAPVDNIATSPKKTTTTKPTSPPTEFMPALRYAGKAGGIIYQTFVDKVEERNLSGETIPSIYDAYFGNKGESVVMRYLKADDRTIETFVGTIPKEYIGSDATSADTLKGYFLPENIKDISLSPDASKIFYLFETGDGVIGTTLDLLNNKKIQIFDSPFTEWLSLWPNNKIVTLSTKPSSSIPGYMYTVDPAKKNLTKILGKINGLTTLTSPDGKLTLFSGSDLFLNIYYIDTKNGDSLGIRTLPEKCVWGKVSDVLYCAVPKLIDIGQYPDVWYQGEVSFNDQFWKIDVKTGTSTIILNPATVGGEEVDGIKLMLDEDENYLFFVNKKDSFLWKFKLN